MIFDTTYFKILYVTLDFKSGRTVRLYSGFSDESVLFIGSLNPTKPFGVRFKFKLKS